MKKRWYCSKKQRFVAPTKVDHYCKRTKCPFLKSKLMTNVIYKVFGLYVNANLQPVIPQGGQFYAGRMKKERR